MIQQPPEVGVELPRRWLVASALLMLAIGTLSFAFVFQLSSGFLFRHDGTGYFLYAYSIVTDFDTEVTDDYLQLDAYVPDGSAAMSGLRTRREAVPEKVVLPWPIGSGLVMAPFYAVGYGLEQAVAAVSGRPANPFGWLPQYVFGLGSLAYGWLGLWCTWLCCREMCCRRVVDARWAAVATLAMVLGGPAVFYIFFHPSMAHAASFGLVALYVLLWWRRWSGEEVSLAGLGFLSGLLVIVRYQNAIFGLLLAALLLRDVYRTSFRQAFRSGLIVGGFCLLPIALQVAHLLAVQGVESAGQEWQTEELTLGDNPIDMSSPFFGRVLFSCHHGAIYWAPIVGVGLLGLLAGLRGAAWARLFVLVFLVDVYLVGSLRGPPELMESLSAPPSLEETNWSGGHAFGMRYLTECASLLAVGLAALLLRIRPGIQRWAAAAGCGLLVAWNGLLLLAYGMGTIDRIGCVTFPQMLAGVGEAVAVLLSGGLG